MRKGTPAGGDSALRAIPSVERILSSEAVEPLVDRFGRTRVKEATGEHLDALRKQRRPYDEAAAVEAIAQTLTTATESSLRRVVNCTGILIHTNLGRSPIGEEIVARAAPLIDGYSNLEFDLGEGKRGSRDHHLQSLCATLFGCEDAILTNNNAAAVLLLLSAMARDREVIVSRGELVEIGGSFRVPDVIQQGGARLREVGTTNRTRASDYADAISGETAAMLRVHRSNFEIVGFTETPSIDELVAIGKLPLLYDEGSGCVVDLVRYGFGRQETIRELIAKGVDAVTCSTDKLIGATQGGLLLGSRAIMDRCRKHPLMRALRAGKESYGIIAETLRSFATERFEQEIPLYRMLSTPIDELRARAEELVEGTACTIVKSDCALGGGTTPAETIESAAIEVPGNANENYEKFLRDRVVGRIVDDRFTLELRSLLPADVPVLAGCLRRASG